MLALPPAYQLHIGNITMASTLDLTGYVLTYDDEFSSPNFQWSSDGFNGYQTTPYHGGRTLYGSNEESMYVDPSIGAYNPFGVDNGALQITAAPVANPNNEPYSTGMATTEGMFNQEWGYFEIRAKIAEGPGMWSSFYLLSADKSWPPEADFELFGAPSGDFGGGQDQFWTGEIAPKRDTQSAGLLVTVPGANIYDDFHTYGISVEPDHIRWYFDGQLVNEVSTPDGFDKLMYMVMSLPVGGWAGDPAGETSAFTIDYMRAYSQNPNATPVDYQTISSPDGANTIPTGVITAKDVALTPTTITIQVAEDKLSWWDAAFIVNVDGEQVGQMQKVEASHAAGEWQTITFNANLRDIPHDVAITFVNHDQTADGSRNLYVNSIAINGEVLANSSASMLSNETLHFVQGSGTTPTPTPDPTPTPTGSGLSVHVAEDAWNGDAQFIVTVDGQQVGGTYTATLSHATGLWQNIDIGGTYSSGPHTVAVQFINDAWGGTAATDRNLYVQSVTINGETISHGSNNASNGATTTDGSAAMDINGTVTYSATGTTAPTDPTPTPPPTGGAVSTIVLHVAEDAWNGDAQFKVLVDGQQVGGTYTATTLHSSGQWQDFTITGDFGSTGPGKVDVQFLNDGWGGSAATDRNLYVQSIDVNGQHFAASVATNNAANGATTTDGSAPMNIVGTVDFNINHTAAPDFHLV
jgi:beta-glucanase (GH16 family)